MPHSKIGKALKIRMLVKVLVTRKLFTLLEKLKSHKIKPTKEVILRKRMRATSL